MVKRTKPVIVWNTKASIYFQKAYEQIREESYANAEKVKNGIIKIIDQLPSNPEKYPPDKFKKDNPGNYRAFEKIFLSHCLQVYFERNQNFTCSSRKART